LDSFTTVRAGDWTAGIVSEELSVTFGPVGGVPVAEPVLEIDPASMSACVVV